VQSSASVEMADCSIATTELYKSRSCTVRVNFFACRVVNVWNSLRDTVSFTSLAVFKRRIRTVDFSECLMCNDV